jgi:hypothetical protein
MNMPRSKALLLLSLATLFAPAFGQSANPARPGTLNYIEGQASIDGRQISPKSVGTAELEPGQYLATADGKAEILLTPGVFLRLDNNSMVKMVSPNLTHTEVQLEHGRASVEADQLYPQNRVLIDQRNGQTQLLKNGLYEFNADANTMRTFDGKAAVYPGSDLQSNVKPVDVKGGKELALTGEAVKPQGFNKDQSHDDLYNWSSLRSQYLGEANVDLAAQYAGYGGAFNPGWYWDSSMYAYDWLPGGYDPFFSPFGFGFYSPYYLYGGGFVYGRGYWGRGYGFHGGYGFSGVRGGFRGGAVGGRAVAGGGFHGGGGGGFHGGGGGGGFHGGGGGGGGHR